MNSIGTLPMVQKHSSTPGTPVSSHVTSLANVIAPSDHGKTRRSSSQPRTVDVGASRAVS
jgi:hypothetical protein